MSFFRDFSCGFGVPSTCRDPQGEMMCASTSFQSRDAPAPKASGCPRRSRAAKRSQEAARLGKSMGFRVPAQSAYAPASGNMMALSGST